MIAQILTWVKEVGKLFLVEVAIAIFVRYSESSLVSLKNLLVVETTVRVVHSIVVCTAGGKEQTDRQTDS